MWGKKQPLVGVGLLSTQGKREKIVVMKILGSLGKTGGVNILKESSFSTF